MTAIAPEPISLRAEIRADVQSMLDGLDERVRAVELSESYAKGLTPDEWVALMVKAEKNTIPIRILEPLAA